MNRLFTIQHVHCIVPVLTLRTFIVLVQISRTLQYHTVGPYSAMTFLSLICIVEKSLSLCQVSLGTVYFCALKTVVV